MNFFMFVQHFLLYAAAAAKVIKKVSFKRNNSDSAVDRGDLYTDHIVDFKTVEGSSVGEDATSLSPALSSSEGGCLSSVPTNLEGVLTGHVEPTPHSPGATSGESADSIPPSVLSRSEGVGVTGLRTSQSESWDESQPPTPDVESSVTKKCEGLSATNSPTVEVINPLSPQKDNPPSDRMPIQATNESSHSGDSNPATSNTHPASGNSSQFTSISPKDSTSNTVIENRLSDSQNNVGKSRVSISDSVSSKPASTLADVRAKTLAIECSLNSSSGKPVTQGRYSKNQVS